MDIHTVGDSHSNKGWEAMEIPGVTIHCHWLGPKLMYSFNRDGLSVEDFKIKSGDVVVFCFGEIDVRCCIDKQKEDDFRITIDTLVSNYFEAVCSFVKNAGVRTCIYFVPPPSRAVMQNPNYPRRGSDEDRKAYTLYMNEKLKTGCKERDFLFIDIYDQYCDADGFLVMDVRSDGDVHIADVGPLVTFIKENIL